MGNYQQLLRTVGGMQRLSAYLAGGLVFWIIAALVCLGIVSPGVAHAYFIFSLDEDASYATVEAGDHDLVQTGGAGTYTLYRPTVTGVLPREVNIDALDILPEVSLLLGDRIVFSLAEDTEISGTYYADEDLLIWDGASLGLLWDGSASGLPPEVNLDAVDIISESPLEFSFSLEEDAVLTGPGLVGDEDVVRYTGSGFSSILDFDSYEVPPGLNLDAFSRDPNTGDFILSFDAPGEIYNPSGPAVSFDDGDLIKFNESATGVWFTLYFDASAYSIPDEVDLNAVALGSGGIASEQVEEYTFDTSTEGWSSSTFTGYSLPSFDTAGGMLNIASSEDTVSRFGFWQVDAGAVTYEADQVFRARYAIQTEQATPGSVPTIRLRFTTQNFTGSASHYIASVASFSYGPSTVGTKEYRTLYYPAVADDLGLAFDMLDFDVLEWGTINLDSVVVEKFARSQLTSPTLVMTYDAEGDFGTWEWNANFGVPEWSGCTSDQIGGTLSITSTGTPEAAFWQTPANDLDYVADKLYRATFMMSRGLGEPQETMPWCRIRCFNEDGQMTQEYNINNGNSGAAMPPEAPTTRDYEVYWQTPDLPGSPTTNEDGFRLSFDMLNFSPGETGTHTLDTVIVEYSEIPAYSLP